MVAPCYLNELCIPVSTVANLSALRSAARGGSASEMTCIVSSGALNSTHSLVVVRSYPEQGYNCPTWHFVWLVRSPGTVYHCTLVRHLHYQLSKTCSRCLFSRCYL